MLDDTDRELLAAAGLTGEPTATVLGGGFANRTWRVEDGDRRVVLRRWTRDPAAAVTELAALREAAADGLPVPQVLAARDSRAVMSFVDGELAATVLARGSRRDAELIGERIGAVFTRVWARPRHPAGEAVPGTDPLEFAAWPAPPRELFEDLLAAARHAPPGWAAFAAGYAESMDYFTVRPVRSHGDANPKNVLLRKENGHYTVAALLDWEFTCAAPAEHDLGNLLRFERHSRVLGPFGRGVLRGTGMSWDQLVIGRRLDLFAMAEMFARPHVDPRMLTRLRDAAERQLAAGQIG